MNPVDNDTDAARPGPSRQPTQTTGVTAGAHTEPGRHMHAIRGNDVTNQTGTRCRAQETKQPYKAWLPDRQLLVMMLGVPGSGKSAFARQLAEALDFDRVSTDAIRTELFGEPMPHTPHTSDQPNPETEAKFTVPTFNELNRRAETSLLAGRSVIRDHMHHRSHWRDGIGQHQADLVGALPVVVWIETPYEIAHQRGMNRAKSADTRTETDAERMWSTINHFHDSIDPPGDHEICIRIDGQATFADQLRHFIESCREHAQTRTPKTDWLRSAPGLADTT